MEKSYRYEDSNKASGFIITTVIHAAILLALLFFYLTPPNPPLNALELGGGGVELNYGEENVGTGDITNLEESSPEPIAEETPAAIPDEPEDIITGDEESVVIDVDDKKKVEEKKPEVKPQDVKTNTTKPVEKIETKAVMGKTNTNKSGEDKNKAGDPGKADGTIDGKALLGVKGNGGGTGGGTGTGNGPSVGGGLAGWGFVRQPAVNDRSQEKGTLVFKIFVNEDGVIEDAKVSKNLGGIKFEVQQLYIKALIGSELENTRGATLNSMTEGSVTWVIVP